MAHITIDLTSARLLASFGDSEIKSDPRWRIILDAKPQWPTRLKLGTGEEIGWLAEPDQIAMKVTFMAGDEGNIAWATNRTKDVGVDEWEKSDHAVIGVMRFSPGSEGTRRDGFLGRLRRGYGIRWGLATNGRKCVFEISLLFPILFHGQASTRKRSYCGGTGRY